MQRDREQAQARLGRLKTASVVLSLAFTAGLSALAAITLPGRSVAAAAPSQPTPGGEELANGGQLIGPLQTPQPADRTGSSSQFLSGGS